jgi:hypothetical protein
MSDPVQARYDRINVLMSEHNLTEDSPPVARLLQEIEVLQEAEIKNAERESAAYEARIKKMAAHDVARYASQHSEAGVDFYKDGDGVYWSGGAPLNDPSPRTNADGAALESNADVQIRRGDWTPESPHIESKEPVYVQCSCGCGGKQDVSMLVPTRIFEHESSPDNPIAEFRFNCGSPGGIALHDLDERPDLQHKLLDESIVMAELAEEYCGKER